MQAFGDGGGVVKKFVAERARHARDQQLSLHLHDQRHLSSPSPSPSSTRPSPTNRHLCMQHNPGSFNLISSRTERNEVENLAEGKTGEGERSDDEWRA